MGSSNEKEAGAGGLISPEMVSKAMELDEIT